MQEDKNAKEAIVPQRMIKDGVWVLPHSPLTQRAPFVWQTLGRLKAPSDIINGECRDRGYAPVRIKKIL